MMTEDRRVRMTQTTLLILEALTAAQPQSGTQIGHATGIASGSRYPILRRLEEAGWLTGEWEQIDPREAGRPRRRFYRLTEFGEAQAEAALARRASARKRAA
jgi:PadR family transcriptional regulator, regulatory protein PadR